MGYRLCWISIDMKLPVYFHIPKCGGTYTQGLIARLLHGEYEDVSFVQNLALGVCCTLRGYKPKTYTRMYYHTGSEDDFLTYVSKCEQVMAVTIMPVISDKYPFFKLVSDLADMQDATLHYFTTIRSPYERLRSLYYHLYPRKFGDLTFEAFLRSEHCMGSWLAQNLLGQIKLDDFNATHLELAYKVLSTWDISEIHNVNNLLAQVFDGIVTDVVTKCKSYQNVITNAGSHNKPLLSDLGKETAAVFNRNMHYDQQLYRLIMRSSLI